VRYSLACALSVHLKEADGALDLLGPYFAKATEADAVTHARIDPDLDPIRDDPRFDAMLGDAEAQLVVARRAEGAEAGSAWGRTCPLRSIREADAGSRSSSRPAPARSRPERSPRQRRSPPKARFGMSGLRHGSMDREFPALSKQR